MNEILNFINEFSQFGQEVKKCFTSVCGTLYDIRGAVQADPSDIVAWDYLCEFEPNWAERIKRDCIDKWSSLAF